MTKKLIYIVVGLLIGIGYTVSAAPPYRLERTVNPETDNTYDLGSSTLRWREIRGGIYYGDGSNLTLGGLEGIITESTSTPASAIALNATFGYMYNPIAGNWNFLRGNTAGGLMTYNSGFAASSTLSDTMTNPLTISLGAYNLFWDGSEWLRAKSDLNGYLQTNSSSSQSGTWNITSITNPVTVNSLPNGTSSLGFINSNCLITATSTLFSVDNASTSVFISHLASTTIVRAEITNAGDGDLSGTENSSSSLTVDGANAYYTFRLAKGESRAFPGYATGGANNLTVLRSAAQVNDNVIVLQKRPAQIGERCGW